MANKLDDIKLDFNDVLMVPRRNELNSRSQVELRTNFKFKNAEFELNGVIPICGSNMDSVIGWEMARILAQNKLMAAIPKHFTLNDWLEFSNGLTNDEERENVFKCLAVTAGTSQEDFDKIRAVCRALPWLKMVCLDVANGYSQTFCDHVKRVREELGKEYIIIAGNVVTPEMVEELLIAGADIVKIGIGPGSVCQTRLKAGVGYPQFSAVEECAEAAHAQKGHVMSDGGCVHPGDIAKAFGGGADFVMLGGMLAGHDECPGELREKDGRKYKLFYGMASKVAQEKHQGGLAEYRASEGKCVAVPLKGPVKNTLQDILGGLRSACTYIGAAQLTELHQNARFIRVNRQYNEALNPFNLPENA